MARSVCFCPSRTRTHLLRLAWGLAMLAPGACGLDRSGLDPNGPTNIDTDDAAAPTPDAPGDSIVIEGSGGRIGAGGSRAGLGGAGGNVVVGTGGRGGTGGSGAGGSGAGGKVGAGGSGAGGKVGAGGSPGLGGNPGVGGHLGVGGAGSGGSGAGGSGAGGSGAGGMRVGTGGSGAGGLTGAGGAGTGGATCQGCTPCERCSTTTGACELDPSSHWDISAGSATLNPVNVNNGPAQPAWDAPGEPVGGSLPDPFVELDVTANLSLLARTRSITDTITPNWTTLVPATGALLNPPMEPIRASDFLNGGTRWLLWVGDDDAGLGVPAGETMCQFNGPLVAADFRAGGFSFANTDACVQVNIKLTCHP